MKKGPQESAYYEADSFSAIQYISQILWNLSCFTVLKTDNHVSLSWARSILSISSHPVHFRCILTLFTCLFLGLPSCLSPEFPIQNPLYICFLRHTCHMSCPSPPSFHYLNYIWWEVLLVMKLLILQSPVIPSHSAPYFSTPSAYVLPLVSLQYKSAIKIIVLYISIFIFFNSKWKTEGSGPNGSKHFLDLVSFLFLHAGVCDLFVLLSDIWTLPHFWRMYQLYLYCIFVPYSVCSQDLNMYLVFWFPFSSMYCFCCSNSVFHTLQYLWLTELID